jgi:hypothetical protein
MAILFTLLQGLEYFEVPYTIADSVYGSTFFMGTGFMKGPIYYSIFNSFFPSFPNPEGWEIRKEALLEMKK